MLSGSRLHGISRCANILCYGALAASLLAHVVDISLVCRFISICAVQPWLKRSGVSRSGASATVVAAAAAAAANETTELWERLGGAPHQLSCLAPKALLFISEFVHEAQVTTRDCDLMGHMNNARYPREADFARHKLFVECGLFDVCWRGKMPLVTAAQSIRYRRELKYGSRFQIRTRVLGWDASNVYLQQVFSVENRRTGDVDVHAVLLVKEAVAVGSRRKASIPHPLSEAMRRLGWLPSAAVKADGDCVLPDGFLPAQCSLPQDAASWVDSLNKTSKRVQDAFSRK
jgi:acyl-CoA thioesterase FadM